MNRLVLCLCVCLVLVCGSCSSRKAAPSKKGNVKYERVDRLPGGKDKDKDKDKKKNGKNLKGADAVVAEARSWVGVPYSYGGKTRKGTDCSGLVVAVFDKAAGITLPRSSSEQQAACRQVKRGNLRPGDLVFFTTGKNKKKVNHVGIYIGNGCMVHASTSRGVMVSDLEQDYYRKTYHSGGRVPGLKGGKDEPQPEPESPRKRDEKIDSSVRRAFK